MVGRTRVPDLEELKGAVASVLDVVTIVRGNVGNVAGHIVESDRVALGGEDSHAALALKEVSPFVLSRVPLYPGVSKRYSCRIRRGGSYVKLPHGAGHNSDLSHGNSLRDWEHRRVCDLHRTARERSRRDLGELVRVGLRHLTIWVLDGGGVGVWRLRGEDVQLGRGNVVEGRYIGLEVLSKDLLGNVGGPVRELVTVSYKQEYVGRWSGSTYQEGRVLREVAVWEDEEELGTIRSLIGALEGVRNTRREIPEVTRALALR